MRDFRLAFRTAARRPWHTTAMALLLGLALAVNTALFSALDLLVLRGLPVYDQATLAVVETEPGRPVSQATLDQLRQHPGFTGVAAVVPGSESNVDAGIFLAQATENLAEVLGVVPARGTWLLSEVPDGIVISWSLWRTRFGGDSGVLGTPIELGGRARVLVGVMQPGFDVPLGTNAWELIPHRTGASYSQFASLTPIARLPSPIRAPTLPYGSETINLIPVAERYQPSDRPALFLLSTGAGLVLALTVLHLIALGLGQVVRQREEAAIRVALGAEGRHLIRQAVSDTAVPATGGFLIALALLSPLQALAGYWLPPESLRGSALTFDWRTLTFGFLLALVVLAIISLVRYLVTPWRNPKEVLAASGASPAGGRRAARVVLAMQTACGVALLYLCGLAIMSLMAVHRTDLGFDPSRLTVLHLPWGNTPLDVRRSLVSRVDESIDAVRELRGVTHAAATMAYPFSRFRTGTVVRMPDGSDTRVEFLHIGEDYFEALGGRLRAGRAFEPIDGPHPPFRAVVSHGLASALMRDGVLPVEVQLGGLPHEIVGVVEDVRMWNPEAKAGFQAYVSIRQRRAPADVILVRTALDGPSPATLASVVQSVWAGETIRAEEMSETIHRLTSPQRARSALMSGLGAAGIVLTLVALAGGLVANVRSRTRELAVRIALGADGRRLVAQVVSEAVLIVSVGIATGLAAGIVFGGLTASVFYGVSALEFQVVSTVTGAFILVALAGSTKAALMACRTEPAAALKAE